MIMEAQEKPKARRWAREKPGVFTVVQTWAVLFVQGRQKDFSSMYGVETLGSMAEFDSYVACEQAIRRVPSGECEIRNQARRWARGKLTSIGDLQFWDRSVPIQAWGAFLREVEIETDRFFEYQVKGFVGLE